MIATFCYVPGALLYNKYLKEFEYRSIMVVACITQSCGCSLIMLFCLGYDLGRPYLYVLLATFVNDILYTMFIEMPPYIYLAKLIPSRIESSMYAFSSGLIDLTWYTLAKYIAILINVLFVHVNYDNLQKTWVLYAIQAGCSLIPLLFIWIIPKRENVAKV